MPCILHARGKEFCVDEFLKETDFKPERVHRRGEFIRRTGRTYEDSGFILVVSEADSQNLSRQIEEAFGYLRCHAESFRKLSKRPDIEAKRLDFLCELRDVPLQSEFFPADFLALAGTLGIGVELSLCVGKRKKSQPADRKRKAGQIIR